MEKSSLHSGSHETERERTRPGYHYPFSLRSYPSGVSSFHLASFFPGPLTSISWRPSAFEVLRGHLRSNRIQHHHKLNRQPIFSRNFVPWQLSWCYFLTLNTLLGFGLWYQIQCFVTQICPCSDPPDLAPIIVGVPPSTYEWGTSHTKKEESDCGVMRGTH